MSIARRYSLVLKYKTIRNEQSKVKFSRLCICPYLWMQPPVPDHHPYSDHTRDDVRTQSSKGGSLYYRTKTTSRSD